MAYHIPKKTFFADLLAVIYAVFRILITAFFDKENSAFTHSKMVCYGRIKLSFLDHIENFHLLVDRQNLRSCLNLETSPNEGV